MTVDITTWLTATHREITRIGGTRSARLRRPYDAPMADVWHACTDRERLRRWFGGVTGEFRVGGELSIDVGMEQPVRATILHCEPPRRLTITWTYADDIFDPVDRVELRLSPDGDRTIVELEHRSAGAPGWEAGVGSGWEDWLLKLDVALRGGDPAALVDADNHPHIDRQWLQVPTDAPSAG